MATTESPSVGLRGRERWAAALGALLTLAMAAGLVRQLAGPGLAGFGEVAPASPAFYLFFALLYVAPPVADQVIFRRLWGLPTAAGLKALAAKRVANEVLFGYAGEAWFYAWAKARMAGVALFAAVKDVTILSAMAGNTVTLIAIAAALPLVGDLLTRMEGRALLGSTGLVIATSVPFLLFRRRVFSLPAPELWRVFGVHMARLIGTSVLLALAWAAALPGVGLGTLLLLSAVRLLFSRLPFVPNKDLLFANFAVLWLGADQPLSGVIAFTAALTLAVHVALMLGFGAEALVRRARR